MSGSLAFCLIAATTAFAVPVSSRAIVGGRKFPRLCFFGFGGDDAGLDLFFELKTLDLVASRFAAKARRG